MQVNFTGISNPCYISLKNPVDENEVVYTFGSILKDDVWGDDYTSFIHALNKNKTGESYINPTNSKMVSLMINRMENEDTFERHHVFRLNGKELPINNKTMPIFDFLAKLTRTIANTPENKLVVNRDYVYSDELRYGLIPGIDLKVFLLNETNNTKSYEEIANIIRYPRNAKDGAQIINDTISEAMVDYFA